MSFIENLYQMFVTLDCSLAEINPLVVTKDGKLLALDAKLNFDDNAMFRHHELAALEDPSEMDPLEFEARKHHLNYIRLTGNVGAMVNGAGLAMATMDLIKAAGAEPANFLDVGGGASAEMVTNGFRIILGDPNVKGVLINIFGGILRCDVLASGVVEAVKTVQVKVPIIVRLEGTNVEQGREILKTSASSSPWPPTCWMRPRRWRRWWGEIILARGKAGSRTAPTVRRRLKPAATDFFLQKGSHMSVLVNNDTRVVVQGVTGKEGSFHALACANTAPRWWPG